MIENIAKSSAIEGPFPIVHAELERARFGVEQYRILLDGTRGVVKEYLLHGPSSKEIQAVLIGAKPANILESHDSARQDLVHLTAVAIYNSGITDQFGITLDQIRPLFVDQDAVSSVTDSNKDLFKNGDLGIEGLLSGDTCDSDDIEAQKRLGLILGFPREAVEYFASSSYLGVEGDMIKNRKIVSLPGYTYVVGSSEHLNTPFTRKINYLFEKSGMNAFVKDQEQHSII